LCETSRCNPHIMVTLCTYRFPETNNKSLLLAAPTPEAKPCLYQEIVWEILCAHTLSVGVILLQWKKSVMLTLWCNRDTFNQLPRKQHRRYWLDKRNLRTMVKKPNKNLLVNGSFACFTSCRRSWSPETNLIQGVWEFYT